MGERGRGKMQILSGVFEQGGTSERRGRAAMHTRAEVTFDICFGRTAATVQLISPLRGFYLGERGYWTRRDKYPLDIMDGVCIYQ